MQLLRRVMRPEAAPTGVFAPEPAAESILAVMLHPIHHRDAVAIVEVAGPPSQDPVDFLHHLWNRTPLRPVVEESAQFLTQVAPAFLAFKVSVLTF